MKKVLFIAVSAMFLSCNESKPTYINCIETTYNLNKEAKEKVVGIDKTKGSFKVEITEGIIKITDDKSKETVLNNDNAYSLTNKKSGDTLIIEHIPTENTPAEILKFGSEYKFYN